jgi:hypothetical protein
MGILDNFSTLLSCYVNPIFIFLYFVLHLGFFVYKHVTVQASGWVHLILVYEQIPCVNVRGKGAMQKRVSALRELRRLLSRYELPPVEAALKAGAISILVQCLSFGSPDEQVYFVLHMYILPGTI